MNTLKNTVSLLNLMLKRKSYYIICNNLNLFNFGRETIDL